MTQNITNFDYVVLIDASGSMANTDGKAATRFERAKESVIGLVSELGAVADVTDPLGVATAFETATAVFGGLDDEALAL